VQTGHELVKERGHNLIYLVLRNYSNSKSATGPPSEEIRFIITHIHVRVPQGFAYAIQYMLQQLVRPDAQTRFPTTPRAHAPPAAGHAGGLPSGGEENGDGWNVWNIMDIKRAFRLQGQDAGDGDSVTYSFKVDRPMAGIRAIRPNDVTYRILSSGNVRVHDCSRIGLPDPDKSGNIRIAFKAHRTKGLGRGTHIRYMQQQMQKTPQPISQELEEMGRRIFGGHVLDMEERTAWRTHYENRQPSSTSGK
jgi:hypothetical protein